jgi:hypothetical protein
MTLDSKALAKICVASNMHKRCPAPCTADAILAGGTIRPLRNDRQNGDVIYTKLIYIIYIYIIYIPVVPHKAVAEVSKMENL